MSGKVVLISATVGVLAAGTGISLAATQGGNNGPVTCIAVANAAAAADANSALSDVFAVGTPLHLASGGRTVDVTVSGPITAAAATSAAATSAAASDSAAPSASDSAAPSASDSTGAGASATATPAPGTSTKPAKKKHHHRSTAAAKAGANPAASATPTDPVAAANLAKSSVKASDNDGVNPNTVCVKLSTNAFNTLGNVGNGNNVGAFIATITPGQAGQGNNAGNNAGNGAGASAAASATPSAVATSPAATTTGHKKTKKHH